MSERLDEREGDPLTETPEGHLAGKPVAMSTYQRHGCRCAGCKGANNEYQRRVYARNKNPKPLELASAERTNELTKRHRIWVDWSGFSAVWVCQCGVQGFGGLSVADARANALEHYTTLHSLQSGTHGRPLSKVHIEYPPCKWGTTVWAYLRGENDIECDRPHRSNGMCSSHANSFYEYEKYGDCQVDGCSTVAMDTQPVCRTHATAWAKAHALDPKQVHKGVPQWPNAPRSKAGRPRLGGDAIQLPYKTDHGTRKGYKAGCRCGPCAIAQSAYSTEARKKRLAKGGRS